MTSVNKNMTKLWRHWVTDMFCRGHIRVAATARCTVVTRSSQGRRSCIAVTSQLHHSHNCEQRFNVVCSGQSTEPTIKSTSFPSLTRTTLTLVKYCASASEKRCTLDTIIGWVDPWVGLGWAESQQYTNVSAESAYCGDCTSYSFHWMIMSLNRILLLLSYWISPVTHCIQHSAALAM